MEALDFILQLAIWGAIISIFFTILGAILWIVVFAVVAIGAVIVKLFKIATGKE